ncbi:MAG: hypothetical protein ACPGOY_10075 [Rhodospirillaceae bacterium]
MVQPPQRPRGPNGPNDLDPRLAARNVNRPAPGRRPQAPAKTAPTKKSRQSQTARPSAPVEAPQRTEAARGANPAERRLLRDFDDEENFFVFADGRRYDIRAPRGTYLDMWI